MAWLTGWTYRKSTTLSRASGAVSDYQVALHVGKKSTDTWADVHCNDHAKEDFSDIRFTEPDGQTLIDHWLEELNRFGRDFNKYQGNPLTLPLYLANGVVHPSVIYFPDGIDGYKYWMVYTPYPPDAKELPTIVRSNDGITWVDTGITNPVLVQGAAGQWDDYFLPDPDIIYVAALSKWFMVYYGAKAGAGKVSANFKDLKIGLAYSSDGKSWTKYGVLVDGSVSYEKFSDTNEPALAYPCLKYESGTFYLWYGTLADGTTFLGGNRGKLCLATFTWNNSTNQVENFSRDAGNPIAYPDQDSDFKNGFGHFDIAYYDGYYWIYAVREIVASVAYELDLFRSANKTTWTRVGKAIARDSDFSWEAQHIYKSSPVKDAGKNIIVDANGKFQIYYSGYTGPCIGVATQKKIGARFLLKPDVISTEGDTIYVYYGKSDASSASHLTNTVVRGEDGVSGNFDTTLGGTATLSRSNGKYTGTEDSVDDVFLAGVILPDWNFKSLIKEFSQFLGITTSTHQSFFGLFDSDTVANLKGTAAVAGPKRRFYIARICKNSVTNPNKFYIIYQNTGGTFYYWTGSSWTMTATVLTAIGRLTGKIWSNGTNFFADILNGDISVLAQPASIAIASVKAFSSGKCLAWGDFYTDGVGITHSIDDYFSIQYVSPEPVWGSWGNEEGEEPPPSGTSFVVWIN